MGKSKAPDTLPKPPPADRWRFDPLLLEWVDVRFRRTDPHQVELHQVERELPEVP